MIHAIVTAYCLHAQPMADGHWPHVGVCAAPKSIPFGTHVLIDGREYVVEDRMGPGHPDGWDVWFPTRSECVKWGKRELDVQILP